MRLEGERYEYEMSVLAHLCRIGARPIEVPIKTIYLDRKRLSHFDPVIDSIRTYSILLRSSFHKGAAVRVGGGVDHQATKHLGVQTVEAAWVHTQLPNSADNRQNAPRLGAGIVYRLR